MADINEEDAEIQGLTVGLVRSAFRNTFPGAHLEEGNRIGGTVLSSNIWQFHIELSVTEHALGYSDKEGEASISVLYKPDPKKPGIRIHQESTTSPSRVWTLVKDTKKFLEGIAAAITMACEEPYYDDTEDVRDLFE